MIGARAYKRHVNEMCNVYIKVSAEDILKRYEEIQKENNETSYDIFDEVVAENPEIETSNEKNEESEEQEVLKPISSEMTDIVAKETAKISKHEKKIRKLKPLIAIAACIIAATSLTIVASEKREMIANIFQYNFGDTTTASLIREGYLYEVNETLEYNGTNFTLLGISGDGFHPVLACDIQFDNEYLDVLSDKIEVDAYILEKEEYENNRDEYGTFTGKGVKDEKTPGLYHVVFDAPRTWLLNEQTVLFHINGFTYMDTREITVPMDVEFEFVVPNESFYKTSTEYINNVSVDYRDTEYTLTQIDFSVYSTMLKFTYDKSFDPNTQKGTKQKYEEKLEKNAIKIVSDSYLLINGQKYECLRVLYGQDDAQPDTGIIYGIYNPLNINSSTEITLNICDFDYKVKEKKKMLSADEYELKQQDICEKLAQAGSTYECNESVEDENYKVTLVRVFGENENPYLQFDVEYKNPEEAVYDEIGLKIRMVNALNYENRDNYNFDMFTGKRDSENPALYHIYGPGYTEIVGNDVKGVVEVFSIVTDVDTNVLTYNDVDMAPIYVHLPKMKLKSAAEVNKTVEDIVINDTDYTFTMTKDSKLYTECEVTFDNPKYVSDESLTTDMKCQLLAWDFVNNTSLIADGNEYVLIPKENGYLINHGFDGDTYTVILKYEPINYYMCKDVYLDVNGEKYILRREE